MRWMRRVADPQSSGQREPVLDGIRGIAVSLVLFHHLVYSSGIDRTSWPDLPLFSLVLPHGWGWTCSSSCPVS